MKTNWLKVGMDAGLVNYHLSDYNENKMTLSVLFRINIELGWAYSKVKFGSGFFFGGMMNYSIATGQMFRLRYYPTPRLGLEGLFTLSIFTKGGASPELGLGLIYQL